jgi:membrane dipeptidase
MSTSRQSGTQPLIWDNHGCMPLRPGDDNFLPQLERYRRAGVNVVSVNAGFDAMPWGNTVLMLAQFRRWIRQHEASYCVIDKVADIEQARQTGRLAITFDIEGGGALNGQLDMVELYYDLGVRWMLIAYNLNNALGGGCQDDDGGLTQFGRQVIDEMQRVGMVICCTHTGFRTTMEVMERATAPVIFSHSNPLGVWQHKRNIRDEAIRACARSGGVVGINGIGLFLDGNQARTDSIVRHIDYVAQLVGVEHVGLGLDYVFDHEEMDEYVRNNPASFPAADGYAAGARIIEPERIPQIAQALLQLGYSDSALRGVLGENHLRVARQVWK